jgi:hypothetical protein
MSRWLAVALLLSQGCTRDTNLLSTEDAGSCSGTGEAVQLGDKAPCAGALAAMALRYALCTCDALVLERGLFTEGGSGGPMRGPPMVPPAAVGTDDYFQVAGPSQVGGALTAAGGDGAGFTRTAAVLGTLRSGGALRANQFLSTGGDAYVAGDLLGKIEIGGTLHVPEGANLAPGVDAADVVDEPVTIDAPCGCAAGPLLDVTQLVENRAALNDDARIQLQPDAFSDGNGPESLDLPCGQYFLKSLTTPDGVELELLVHGRVALFVGGDVQLGNGLRVTLDTGAELDLIVAGDFAVQSGTVGAEASELVRLWLGSATIRLGSMAALSASVYAPSATLLGDGDLGMRGALLVGSLSVPGDVSIHYDADLLYDGLSCGAPAQSAVQ